MLTNGHPFLKAQIMPQLLPAAWAQFWLSLLPICISPQKSPHLQFYIVLSIWLIFYLIYTVVGYNVIHSTNTSKLSMAQVLYTKTKDRKLNSHVNMQGFPHKRDTRAGLSLTEISACSVFSNCSLPKSQSTLSKSLSLWLCGNCKGIIHLEL